MRKTLNKYIRALSYADKTLLAVVSLCPFATVVGAPVGIAIASVSLVFHEGNRILKVYLKTMGRKRNKHRKIILLDRSKLNCIGKKCRLMQRLVMKSLA